MSVLQMHQHSTYCKKTGKFRFKFPHPPSTQTLIAQCPDNDDTEDVTKCLGSVRKLLVEGKTDVSIDELLAMANTNWNDYEKAISTTTSGSVVVLKRNPKDCNVNNYNPNILKAWQANMDIQNVMNPYACIMYIASYMTKSEKSMGELLKQAACAERTAELTTVAKSWNYIFETQGSKCTRGSI